MIKTDPIKSFVRPQRVNHKAELALIGFVQEGRILELEVQQQHVGTGTLFCLYGTQSVQYGTYLMLRPVLLEVTKTLAPMSSAKSVVL
jgi:hypothetical protein